MSRLVHVQLDFNPRSHEGNDGFRYSSEIIFIKFQSTFPRGERRILQLIIVIYRNFNPRSHEGNDGQSKSLEYRIYDFNPRSHEGNDPIKSNVSNPVNISIHVPTRGTTEINNVGGKSMEFQSTFPRGERL